MATVLRREFRGVSQSTTFRVTPIGDIHIGAAACDEGLLFDKVKEIEEGDDHYWIGLGDYCDFINMKDPRFAAGGLAAWITPADLMDLAKAQLNMLYRYLDPIAHKCLGMVMGNHELAIMKHTERDVFTEIVCHMKEVANMPESYKLGMGIYGWIKLVFYNAGDGETDGERHVKINVHHGFTGGKLAGAKALDMQRWLWSHDADLVVFGHCHQAPCQPEAVEILDKNDNIVNAVRKGMYSGTFLRGVDPKGSVPYSEVKGYLPNPVGIIPTAKIKPWETRENRVRILE